MATNLFAIPGMTGAQTSLPLKTLVEFRAGKMDLDGNKVIPNKRKGLIQLGTDSLIHFFWKDRTTGHTEDDFVIFPEDASIKRLQQCTSGRVLLLEFKATSKRLFYWIQEPKEDKDEEFVSKINEYINNPPQTESPSLPSFDGRSPNNTDPSSLFQMLQSRANQRSSAQNPPLQSPLLPSLEISTDTGHLLRNSNSSATSNQNPSTTGMSAGLMNPNMNTFRQEPIPSSLQESNMPRGQTRSSSRGDIRFGELLSSNPDLLNSVLSNPQVQEQLLPLLPEGHRVPEELMESVRSPQFQQTLETLDALFESGQLASIFGLSSSSNGERPLSMEQFLQALQEQMRKKTPPEQKKDDKQDDSSMDTS